MTPARAWSVVATLAAVLLRAAPAACDEAFPWVLQWKRLTRQTDGPVAWNDSLVFIGEPDGTLSAIGRHDGVARWSAATAGPPTSLAVSQDLLLLADGRGGSSALRVGDGSLLWQTQQPLAGAGRIAIAHGFCYRASADGRIHVFRLSDGSEVWKLRTGARSPAASHIDGHRLYAATTDGSLICADARTGARQMRISVGATANAIASAGDAVLTASADGYLRFWSADDLRLKWQRRLGAKLRVPPLTLGGRLVCVADNHFAYGLSLTDGVANWKLDLGQEPTSVIADDDEEIFLVATRGGRVVAVAAKTGVRIWEKTICAGAARIYGDTSRLYVRAEDGYLYAFSPRVASVQSPGSDAWYAVFHGDRKTGYVHRWSEPLPTRRGYRMREEAVSWGHGFVRTLSVHDVDGAFHPVAFSREKIEENQRLTTSATWLGGQRVRIERSLAGYSRIDTIRVDSTAVFPEFAVARLAARRAFPARDTVLTFDSADNAVRPLYIDWHGRDAAKSDTIEAMLTYGATVDTTDAGGDRHDELLARIPLRVWIDDAGGELRTEIPMLSALSVRVDRGQAQDWEPPDDPPRLRLDHAIAAPALLRRLVLRLPGALGAPHLLFAQDERQSLRQDSLGTLLVVEARPQPPDLRSESDAGLELPLTVPGTRRYLAPSLYVQSQDPRIRALSARIVADERLATVAARRLHQWVYDHMIPVATNVRFKSALEVLDDMKGTCSEYTVLYTALCRAAGIPTRVAVGFALSPRGELVLHIWPEVFLGDWIGVDPSWDAFPVGAAHIKTGSGLLDAKGLARMNLPLQMITARTAEFHLIEYEIEGSRFTSVAEELFSAAEDAARNYEEERAQELFHRLILLDWNHRSAEAHSRIARYHLQHDRLADAEWVLERLLRLGPGNADTAAAWFYMGRLAQKRENWEDAHVLFERLADEYPESELADDALGALAELLATRRGCRSARPYYRRLIEEHSRSGWASIAESALSKCCERERMFDANTAAEGGQ